MDSSLKTRLIGAVIVIILAAIFLPMLLNHSSSQQTDIDLHVPNPPDADFETRIVPLNPTPKNEITGAAPDISAQESSDIITTVDIDSQKPIDAFSDDSQQSSTQQNDTPAATAATDINADQAEAAITPSKQIETEPTSHTTALPATLKNGRFVVNLGTYTNIENAKNLLHSLQKNGITAFSESITVNGKAALRIRTGPYVDRTQAEQARIHIKLARADLAGVIVEIDNVKDASTSDATTSNTTTTGWVVQVGAFKTEADANLEKARLKNAGYSVFIDPVHTESGILYRVRIGPETLRNNAENIQAKIAKEMGIKSIITTYP